VFAGKGRGIIYVQGEQKQTVTKDRMLDARARGHARHPAEP
jgi:hypothetical protein